MKRDGKRYTKKKYEKSSFTALDLYSGGGGLTTGLKRAGFNVIGAVEVESNAFSTYKANYPEVHVYKQDLKTVAGQDLLALSRHRTVDLVAGCPPCQGFSSLTSKYRRHDPRNDLVREMSRIIKEVQPKAVMMENVPGLAKKGKPLFDEFLNDLESLGYKTSWDVLQVADFGVPQNRRRLVVLAGHRFTIPLPEPTHSRDEKVGLKPWRTVRDTIKDMPEPIVLNEAMKQGGPQNFNWHVIRTMSCDNLKRLRHSKPGTTRYLLPDELRPECHKGLNKGFSNVYGRMSWDQPSVTITGGCTTLSKGRFGHPERDRTISVREAALLQTFPPDYVFDTPYMEHVCDIIGNALPCDFAEVLARVVYKSLIKRYVTMAQAN